MLFHVGYAATFFCGTLCYHLPIYAKVSPLAFFWIFPISYCMHGDCYVVMVIFIYTKLGALNMVIRMTENVRSLWTHWSHCWGSVHIPLRGFNINQLLIQRRTFQRCYSVNTLIVTEGKCSHVRNLDCITGLYSGIFLFASQYFQTRCTVLS
jgi:hypothetical protein